MRILQVITSLHFGGAEKLIVDLVPRLRAIGHDVDVCLFNGEETPLKKQLRESGCKIYELGVHNDYYNPFLIIKLWRVMRNYNIVHTHNTAPQLFAAFADMFCSTKLVTTEHNTYNRRRQWAWYRVFDRWMYNRYEKVICISKQAEKNIKDYLVKYNTEIFTINNGVDIDLFRNSRPNNLLKTSNRFVVAMVASFRAQKDQDTLVKAMRRLDKELYEIWFVGEGERRTQVEELVRKYDLNNNIVFYGVRSDIPEILKASDVVVISSHWEGFGLAAVEGMAATKPVIASNVDGLAQVVQGAGLLFMPQNDAQLAQLIEKLSADSSFYEMVAKRCAARAMEYDISVMMSKYEEVYNSLSYSCDSNF